MTCKITLSSGQVITITEVFDYGVSYDDNTVWFVFDDGVVDDYPRSEVEGVEISDF